MDQFSQGQILSILEQMDAGANIDELCKQHKVSSNTLYGWKARFGGTESLISRLEELEKENYVLKGKLADVEIQREAENTGDMDRIYRIMATNIPGTAITILDREERYLLAEGDFLLKMGYVKETMPGKKISEIITPENYDGYYKEVIRSVFAGETVLVERQTLSGYYTLMKAVPLRDGKNNIFAIMFVLIDVTAMKEAQFELKKTNEELESRVIERTEQLREANTHLESFSYSVSHDLQAPLRAIAGFARILKEDYAKRINDEVFDETTERIIASALRMSQLINDLLEFSKLGRKEISKSNIDMNKLVKNTLNELLAQEDPNRRIDVKVSELASVQGDLRMMQQVWINLISNALKYSRKKDFTTIEISCTSDDGKACYVIKDNGVGFNMKYAQKLFGVFQRMHSLADFEGTGIGLALVQNIIQRHDGNIWAEAEVDKGATFYFTLPINNE